MTNVMQVMRYITLNIYTLTHMYTYTVPATAVLESLSFNNYHRNPEKKQDSGIHIQTIFSCRSVVYLPNVLTE